jgi:cobalt-zinc-cadmium efflux system membrane fusion protein
VNSAWNGLVLAAAVALLAACGERDGKAEALQPKLEDGRVVFPQGSAQIAAFATEVVKAGDPPEMRLTGRLAWDEERTVRLFPAFAGRVVRILVKPGDAVGQGQALAVLASPDFGQAQADARRAQADFALAEKNLARLRELHANGVAARKDLQSTEAEYARAESELQRALAKIRLQGGGTEGVDQSFALRSPIAGVVVERNINPGQELRQDLQLANSPAMFVVTDPARLWVLLDATERDLADLRVGATVVVHSSAYPEASFKARIDAISDFVDPATRTVKVRGSLANHDRRLKGEMFVTAEWQTETRVVVQVPSKAVQLAGDKHYAFIEEAPGRFARVEVKVDGEHGGVTGIASGLAPGQRVVVDGGLFLERIYRQLGPAGRS